MAVRNIHRQETMIPIFPLGVVLLPEMRMPLHIFEERYKTMIRECLDRQEPFGIVYFDGKGIHRVGCTARILEVSRRYEDGRMDIVVQGVQRFHMDRLDESRSYLMSGIHYVDDAPESLGREIEALVRKNVDLLRRLDRLAGLSGEEKRLDEAGLKRLSFLVPGAEGFSLEERQRFLEMTSARERLEKGSEVLERVIARAKISREIAELIGGNGHLRSFITEKGLQV
ncbi:MAG: LON peptidase substrate-binding domain-containing protein [Deltaproteobacteria bacterium]|nr:LON peptidase substrate-binding domain-containing protein [Deltaproteobacteria bacterium]